MTDRKPSYRWSISVYRGDTPFVLKPPSSAPLLVAEDVIDIRSSFVADPFMLRRAGLWHMFFEVLRADDGRGEIGHATSRDGNDWQYNQIVLREPFHLSYPYVLRWKGETWMIPETLGANAIRLYRATRFPDRWTHEEDLLPIYAADPSVFRHRNRWWMFVCTTPHTQQTLALYMADDLRGPWREHPANPIVPDDRRIARPAGRPRRVNGRLIRFAQDCSEIYGKYVRAFEILELTPDTYRERELPESPILGATGSGWNSHGMHQIDAHHLPDGTWLACVDGKQLEP